MIDSCIADAVVPSGFGVKADVQLNTSQHEDEDACTSSLMLLRFSVNGGSGYYNEEEPRTAIAVECAFHTPNTKKLADTVVRSAPLVRTAIVDDRCREQEEIWR